MTHDMILANATLVLPTETIRGSIAVGGDKITAVASGTAVPVGAEDCEGDYIAPGLIELHTDNLERHIHPRPKVDWPHQAAIVAHDAELASVGITTVFDAIRVGSIISDPNKKYGKYARQIANEILSMRAHGGLKISHHLHLRAEVCSESLIEELEEFGVEDRVGIVSLMDHTPGQRQFSDLSKYRDYITGKYGMGPDAFDGYVDFLYGLRSTLGEKHEQATVAAAKRYGAVLASHDDTTQEQVRVSSGYGIHLAEFPTTVEAARACHDHQIATIMGGPNLVRGGSHSGNVAAIELADMDLLDIISSDYVPSSLLLGAVQLGQHWGDMAKGIATVTSTPARMTELHDRGCLEVGMQADLIRFRLTEGVPALRAVWSKGNRVA
ncbi:alpha-D-ribose 1-methylphosphonate 5-triphosphate diphosphatase [Shimia thalassica]|uniref:alpha-D-ribose 1-methylphosphonate 5-triphosphate diphosphatase n=1 Tax=Shimia thalassica TaxID=1715693 RepID=UPI0026E295F6|nr:alpha-D-ribose 1-methylphosphonate 5-triphosphate diphosphatase [Shimia thalassica]MDO6484141.1 alpha-D-ribose 1-methylphosphonate 5-triphosphate diphosphatase [Shimia thalassica]